MRKTVYEVSGILKGEHDTTYGSMIDSWQSMLISADQFKDHIFEIGVPYAKANQVTAWIVDTSKAKGVFKKEVLELIDKEVAPAFAGIGIKHFITITPESALTKLTVNKIEQLNSADQHGMHVFSLPSTDSALQWLQDNP